MKNNLLENSFCHENLKSLVCNLSKAADEVLVISGYGNPEVISEIANNCDNTTVALGMYVKEKKSSSVYKSFEELASQGRINLKYTNDRTHAKIYVFKKDKKIFSTLVGSANISDSGLTDNDNGEVLIAVDNSLFPDIESYCERKLSNSIDCQSYDYSQAKCANDDYSKVNVTETPEDRFSVEIPLYSKDSSGAKYTPLKSGLNWGNQTGHSKKKGAMEAYINVSARNIDKYPIIFQPKQEIRTTSSGKSSRVNDPIKIIWDDGVIMDAIFSGNGPKRNGRLYPNKITSADGGGSVLGAYIRNRLGVGERSVISYSDLEKYGRTSITLTYIQNGMYKADFSIAS